MTNSRVTGVRSIELGVRDLHQSAEFYTKSLGARRGRPPKATASISAPPAASTTC